MHHTNKHRRIVLEIRFGTLWKITHTLLTHQKRVPTHGKGFQIKLGTMEYFIGLPLNAPYKQTQKDCTWDRIWNTMENYYYKDNSLNKSSWLGQGFPVWFTNEGIFHCCTAKCAICQTQKDGGCSIIWKTLEDYYRKDNRLNDVSQARPSFPKHFDEGRNFLVVLPANVPHTKRL